MSTSPEAPVKRVRLSPDERKTQLITLGVKMLGERAIEDISVSEIADRAGISRGLLFHYFPTKQDFQLEVIRHANAELLARVVPDPTLSLFEMLRDSVGRYIDYVSENRTSYLALLRGPTSSSPELAAMVEQTRHAIVDIILAQVPLSPEEREQPRLMLVVRGWVAFTEETTLSWLLGESLSRDELIELLVESLVALSMAVNPALAAALRP
ncbi:TetR/AcrR family transcriptional regulator [Nocardia testacea]|uniref:TetR/AcrR family transcriptional regulator n=1 Tax=Nocardia testacea TaxID=248551 RepID=UPI0002E446AE|nr:TetR/AcrR family transcriptional regulator [Nocardia testacea]